MTTMAETLKKYGITPLKNASPFDKMVGAPARMVRLRRALYGESPYEPKHARQKNSIKWRMK